MEGTRESTTPSTRQTYRTNSRPPRIYHWYEETYWEYIPTADPHVYSPLSPSEWEPIEDCTPIDAYHTPTRNIYIRVSKSLVPHRRCLPPPTSFDQYVTTLQEWERDLLDDITFVLNPYEIYNNIQGLPLATTLYLVSDGSQKDDQLSYGWVFGTSTGTVYAEHSGKGYGTPSSHRAESWGLLSGVLFVVHLHKYIHISRSPPLIRTPLQFFSDNNGLIQRINTRRQYQISYPNSTLAPEWDLIEQIYVTSHQVPHYDIAYSWVKGHQDTLISDLPVEAQYNVRADILAGQVWLLPSHTVNSPRWLLPVEKCRLVISNNPVYGNYIQEIRKAATLPPYIKYLRGRHGWTSHETTTIDWQVLESAVKSTVIPQTQLVKLVHGKLPTRYELSKSNLLQRHDCPYCHTPETFAHLLRCTNQGAQQFRDDLLEAIEDYFTRHEAPQTFRQTFFVSTQYWLDPSLPSVPESTPSTRPVPLIAQQQIGWELLPRGFLSISWRKLYEETSPNAITHSSRPIPFMAGLVKLLWTRQLQYWQAYTTKQNDSANPHSWSVSEKRLEYQTRIRILHQQRSECLHAHQTQYFYDDVESFLTQATNTQMRMYLHHYTSAISHSIVSAKRSQTKTIFQFPGFTHLSKRCLRSAATRPDQRFTQSASPILPGIRGVQIIRKHTRWRNVSPSTTSIRAFFSPSTPPP